MEFSDYKMIEEKGYGLFHYVNSSYSFSRSEIIYITNFKILNEVSKKIPTLRDGKCEYTDIHILGIKDFDQNNLTETDSKIIDAYLDYIVDYRTKNNLPTLSKNEYYKKIIFVDNQKSFFKIYPVSIVKKYTK